MSESFKIVNEKFSGPLELLLDLIEKRKLLINDFSLATVADDFIEYTKKLENFPISESANFILIASTLVLIKSKSLLPTLELTSEEQTDIRDLEYRLKELERIRAVSLHIQKMFGRQIMFNREPTKNYVKVFAPTKEIELSNLKQAMNTLLSLLPKPQKMSQAVVKKVISLEETIERLMARVEASFKMSFRDFSKTIGASGNEKEAKINLVVGFLAMLELVKRGIIHVNQNSKFGEIEMENHSVNTPKYGM